MVREPAVKMVYKSDHLKILSDSVNDWPNSIVDTVSEWLVIIKLFFIVQINDN